MVSASPASTSRRCWRMHNAVQSSSFAEQPEDELIVFIPHRKRIIRLHPSTNGSHLLAALGVEGLLLIGRPAQPHAPLLPRRQVVEVDPLLKEQLVLSGR